MSFTAIVSFLLILGLLGVSCLTYGWFGFMLIAIIVIATVVLVHEVMYGFRRR